MPPTPTSAPGSLRLDQLWTLVGGPFDLAVPAGQCAVLMGPSGTGKSLLLRALADLDPHRGEVWLGDRRQTDTPPWQWRRQVTYVPAAAGWWAETVGEHFNPDGVPGSLEPLAALTADLTSLSLPADCGSWPVARLSSGERQRLSLLRALAHRPQVLLLDEPTANLDAATALAVESWILSKKTPESAWLWVTHDPEQARRVGDAVYLLEASGLVQVAANQGPAVGQAGDDAPR